MWTSFGNGFTNLMTFLFICNEKGIYPDSMPLPDEYAGGILVEGDDGLFALPDRRITSQDFEDLSWKIKMDYTSDISKTSFCSNYFSPVTKNHLVPPEAAIRVFYSFDRKYYDGGEHIQRAILKAKAMSLLCSGENSPITSVLAKTLIRLIPEQARFDEFCTYEIDQLLLDYVEPQHDTAIEDCDRVLYSELFNVSVNVQLSIEDACKNAKSLSDLDFPISISSLNNEFSYEGLGPGCGH